MLNDLNLTFLILLILTFTGCASVPMAPLDQDMTLKDFSLPPEDKSALYIYRNSFFGAALKKNIYLDGKFIGESAEDVYFYILTTPGHHNVSTESEFSENSLSIDTVGGKNYYIQQYIKMGVFVGGANLKLVNEEQGQKEVLKCKLAKNRF